MNIPNFINKEIFSELLVIDQEDPGFLQSIIQIYLDHISNSINNLYDFINIRDFEECSKIAHKLKGSSLSIGLNIISLCCEKIEYLGKNQDNLSSDHIYKAINLEINLLKSHFRVVTDFLLQFITKK
jgi:HPt (histidine-containing phosphotransfer) domain-containing protein